MADFLSFDIGFPLTRGLTIRQGWGSHQTLGPDEHVECPDWVLGCWRTRLTSSFTKLFLSLIRTGQVGPLILNFLKMSPHSVNLTFIFSFLSVILIVLT